MPRDTGTMTSKPTERPTMMPIPTTARSTSPTTSSVPNNASTLGNAEVPDPAREADFAQDGTHALRPHSQCKLQESSQTIDQITNNEINVKLTCSYIFKKFKKINDFHTK